MKTKQLLILTIALLLTACNSKSPSPSQPMAYGNAAVYQVHSEPIIAPQGVQPAPIPQAVMSPRKIAIRASIDIDVDNVNEAQKKLNGLVQDFGGHIENAHQSESSYYSANLKVPSNKLMATLDAIAELGDKTSQSINKRDITERFNNNEERLKNLKLFYVHYYKFHHYIRYILGVFFLYSFYMFVQNFLKWKYLHLKKENNSYTDYGSVFLLIL